MSVRSIEVELLRFCPDLEEAEVWESFSVECDVDATLLDVLLAIQSDQDPTLAFRWSCRIGQCGACGVSVNESPVLACHTAIRDLRDPIRIAPLANLPVVRDLVCELDGFQTALAAIRPSRQAPPDPANWTSPGSVGTVGAGSPGSSARRGATECIECGLCYSACPAVHRSPSFVGPAALARAWEVIGDPRSGENELRRRVLSSEEGVWNCGEGGECTEVCPLGVSPSDAATALKFELVRGLIGLGSLRGKR